MNELLSYKSCRIGTNVTLKELLKMFAGVYLKNMKFLHTL